VARTSGVGASRHSGMKSDSYGQRVSGTYRRSITLASGRFAMLENGIGFTLVPWGPIIEQHIGRSVEAAARGDFVSWQLGRQPDLVASR
jgi:hypothetical protein